MNAFIRETTSSIKKTVGKGKVILNITPTLNSFVTALLVNRAIGKKLKCFFIDNGLLRKDEKKQIKKTFERHGHLNLSYVDRSKRFFQELKGVVKPEEKRAITKSLFIKVFQEVVKKVKDAEFLAQEILYPEASKSSRNPGCNDLLQESRIKLKPLQPLRDLFKEEVKIVAKELGLPDNIVFKQPFPETGLVTRIIGEVTPARLKTLREAQHCLVEEIKAAGIFEEIWQSFAILLSTGNVVAIRCIASTDGVTAEWVRLPYPVLDKICRRIINKVKGVKRVVYDISSQPPATIEWE